MVGCLVGGQQLGAWNFFLMNYHFLKRKEGWVGPDTPHGKKPVHNCWNDTLGFKIAFSVLLFEKIGERYTKKTWALRCAATRKKSLNLWSPDPYSPPTNLPPIKPCPPPQSGGLGTRTLCGGAHFPISQTNYLLESLFILVHSEVHCSLLIDEADAESGACFFFLCCLGMDGCFWGGGQGRISCSAAQWSNACENLRWTNVRTRGSS